MCEPGQADHSEELKAALGDTLSQTSAVSASNELVPPAEDQRPSRALNSGEAAVKVHSSSPPTHIDFDLGGAKRRFQSRCNEPSPASST